MDKAKYYSVVTRMGVVVVEGYSHLVDEGILHIAGQDRVFIAAFKEWGHYFVNDEDPVVQDEEYQGKIQLLKSKLINELPEGKDWYLSKGASTYLEVGGELLRRRFSVNETYELLKRCFFASKVLFE